ncbi:MAG: class I adenylate-forming enzyme family protein [Chloroflexi bacterium]|nr:class I adenylate-forming enzyme family protein [Chloroflexota bacterium]
MNERIVGLSSSSQPYTEKTMVDVVEESARTRPYRGMLLYGGGKIIYNDFIRISDAFCAGLIALGVRPGDHVAVLLPNSPQMILAIHAIWKAGAVVMPIDIMCAEEGLVQAVNGTFVSVIIVSSHCYDMVKRVQPGTGIRVVIVTNCEEFLPFPNKIVSRHAGKENNGFKLVLKTGDLWFKHLLSTYKDAKRPLINIRPSRPAVTFFSVSGMSYAGYIRISHQDLMNVALQMRAWLGPVLDEWEDRFLLSAHLSGVFGFLNAMGTAMVNHSTCVLIPDTYGFTEVLKSIRKCNIAVVMDDAEFFRAIMNHSLVRSGRIRLKGLKAGIVSSAGLTIEEKTYFEGLTGGHLLECYAVA